MKNKCKLLADSISALLQKGFRADAGVMQYIHSVFGDVSVNDLQHLLTVEKDGDGSPLVDLIVSPDAEMQQQLEAILERHHYEQEDMGTILAFFPSTIHTFLDLPGNNDRIFFTVSSTSVSRFLEQVRIDRQIAPRVQAALENRLGCQEDVRTARVLLRNARNSLSGNQVPVFVRFVESYPVTDHSQFMEAMALLVSVSGRQMPSESVQEALGREKQRRLRQIRATEQAEQKIARKNMETLMLQGSRGMLMVDKSLLFREIGIIDRIALAVFGEMPDGRDAEGERSQNDSDPWASFLFEKPDTR